MAFGWTRPISVFGSQIRKPKISALTSPSHALRTLVLAPSGPRSIFGVIDSEPGRDAECFGPTVRMTSALPARWLAALARERRPCPARKGGRGKGSPCRRSFRRREYRAGSRNRPAPPPPANSARRRRRGPYGACIHQAGSVGPYGANRCWFINGGAGPMVCRQ